MGASRLGLFALALIWFASGCAGTQSNPSAARMPANLGRMSRMPTRAIVLPGPGGGAQDATTAAPITGNGSSGSPITLPTSANPQINSLGVGAAATGTAGEAKVHDALIFDQARSSTPTDGIKVNASPNQFMQLLNNGGDAEAFRFSGGGADLFHIGNVYVQLRGGLSYLNLPACSGGLEGADASIVDSNTATWGATAASGGANHVKVYCDGTTWTVEAK